VPKILPLVLLLTWGAATGVNAADKLVLELDMDEDLISLAHHIDNFLFTPTLNFSLDVAGNLSDRVKVDALHHHLAVTTLVRIDGEIAGFATEQETVRNDPDTGLPYAESAWLITLNHPSARGVLSVTQRENAGPTFGLVREVMDNPGRDWADEPVRFLSTDGDTRVPHATGDLRPYQGGRFEEYNFVNPADFARYGRFRARIEFVIHPAVDGDPP